MVMHLKIEIKTAFKPHNKVWEYSKLITLYSLATMQAVKSLCARRQKVYENTSLYHFEHLWLKLKRVCYTIGCTIWHLKICALNFYQFHVDVERCSKWITAVRRNSLCGDFSKNEEWSRIWRDKNEDRMPRKMKWFSGAIIRFWECLTLARSTDTLRLDICT